MMASGSLVWIHHETDGFATAMVKGTAVQMFGGEQRIVSEKDIQICNPSEFDKVEDMAKLPYLNEASVLYNLKERYLSDQNEGIYTYAGLSCVAVNPYESLPIYSEKIIDLYKGKKRDEMRPHVYAVAETCYMSMLRDRYDQSVIFTGESGAGKTENTNRVIQYLTRVAGTKPELDNRLLQANQILDAFGNAKTVKNDNSSRFSKFIRIKFDKSGFISGGNIDTYLLEKSRVNRQAKDERSFHIFYQLLQGASSQQKEQFLLEDIKGYRFMSNGYVAVPGVDDIQEFQNTIRSMQVLQFQEDEISAILRMISAVLHFGNMEIQNEENSEQAILPKDTVAQKVCKLLGLPVVDDLKKALLRPRIKVGGEYVDKSQSKEQAKFSVEKTAKACYELLFKWIVHRFNLLFDRKEPPSSWFIGILDITGFENAEINTFEQLCVNYTNEKLQQFFNDRMAMLKHDENQGIDWQFVDLKPTINLIEKSLGILDEECWLPNSNDASYVEKLKKNLAAHPKFVVPDGKSTAQISIIHFAGRVNYACENWLMKNMDPLNENVVSLLQKSSNQIVVNIWKDAEFSPAIGSADRTTRKEPIGQSYKEQLSRLMATLNNTTAHFVRCIIPNYEKKAGLYTATLVLDQIRRNDLINGMRIGQLFKRPDMVIFISYRRHTGSHLAAALKTFLMNHGWTVFMDVDDLVVGDFELQLREAIHRCKLFIGILTFGSMDRCNDKADPVRLEFETAMNLKKPMMSVFDGYFDWSCGKKLQTDWKDVSKVLKINGVNMVHEYRQASWLKIHRAVNYVLGLGERMTLATGSDGQQSDWLDSDLNLDDIFDKKPKEADWLEDDLVLNCLFDQKPEMKLDPVPSDASTSSAALASSAISTSSAISATIQPTLISGESSQAKNVQEEEIISNHLATIRGLKTEKAELALRYEQEGEILANDFSSLLNQLRENLTEFESTQKGKKQSAVSKLRRKVEQLEIEWKENEDMANELCDNLNKVQFELNGLATQFPKGKNHSAVINMRSDVKRLDLEMAVKQERLEKLSREMLELEKMLEREKEALVNRMLNNMDKRAGSVSKDSAASATVKLPTVISGPPTEVEETLEEEEAEDEEEEEQAEEEAVEENVEAIGHDE